MVCLQALDTAVKKALPLFAGKCRTDAPDKINPNSWIGYVGLGAKIISPGALMACAIFAKPSFEPSVATI
ncbi:MAG TPA: hypothetical protein TECP_00562 [Hyphomicrobiaceae bacterium MAG_BT-2024]